ncbi:DNA-binding protein [Burkholderiales bacterium 8X]|nr:DNA-binding protein [Burkholderiales bacterium 8X]
MENLIVLLILCAIGWKAYTHFDQRQQSAKVPLAGQEWRTEPTSRSRVTATNALFKCDGRTHCSQMSSCEEATFFLKNCPGVKMDGNGDGVPCEKQWCR